MAKAASPVELKHRLHTVGYPISKSDPAPRPQIGFSMGARLIFHCLLELSRCGARGLVESAVLLGTPVSASEPR